MPGTAIKAGTVSTLRRGGGAGAVARVASSADGLRRGPDTGEGDCCVRRSRSKNSSGSCATSRTSKRMRRAESLRSESDSSALSTKRASASDDSPNSSVSMRGGRSSAYRRRSASVLPSYGDSPVSSANSTAPTDHTSLATLATLPGARTISGAAKPTGVESALAASAIRRRTS